MYVYFCGKLNAPFSIMSHFFICRQYKLFDIISIKGVNKRVLFLHNLEIFFKMTL